MAEQSKGPEKGLTRKLDYKSRQAQKRAKGGIVTAFAVVAVLGLLCGGAYIKKDQILAFFQKEEPAVVAKPTPQPRVEPAAPAKLPEPPAPVAAPIAPPEPMRKIVVEKAPNFSTTDEQAAIKLIADGRTELEKFNFEKSRSYFNQAALKQASPKTQESAKTWEHKAQVFEVATKHIPVSEYASAETSYVLQTRDGDERTGLIVRENDQEIVFQEVSPDNPSSLGKQFLPIPKAEVTSKTPISLEQRQEEFLKLLGSLEEKAVFKRSTDYYDTVYLSKRLGLGHYCVEYLNRAYNGGEGHAPDPYLDDSFRKEVVRREIDRAALQLAGGRKPYAEMVLNDLIKKKLPGYQVAIDEVEAFRMKVLSKVRDDFKSTLTLKKVAVASTKTPASGSVKAMNTQSAKQLVSAGEETDFVVDSGGVQGKGSAAPVVDKANAKYDEGMHLYRGFKLGTNGNNNETLEAAMKCLVQAVDLYDEALKKDPGNKSVSDRQTEANMIVYACKKYHTL